MFTGCKVSAMSCKAQMEKMAEKKKSFFKWKKLAFSISILVARWKMLNNMKLKLNFDLEGKTHQQTWCKPICY